jgi:anti-sigma factor RsiW
MRRIADRLRRFGKMGVPGVMSCAELDSFIVDYMDGSLPFRQRAVFRFHLLMCRKCSTYLKSYRQTVALGQKVFSNLGKPAVEEAPEELVRAILSARPR